MSNVKSTVLLFLLFASGALAAAPLLPSIRQVDYVVESYDAGGRTRESKSLFVLFLGSPQSERLEAAAAAAGVTKSICLVHPVGGQEETGGARAGRPHGASSSSPGRSRWYVTETDTSRGLFRHGPLLSRAVWYTIPVVQRRVLMALGPDDEELMLISWSGVTDSISVYYAPRVQADRAFFERKLELLRGSLEAQDPDADVPYERIDAEGAAAALVSCLR